MSAKGQSPPKRNRATGWKHAKTSGETYESIFAKEVVEEGSPTRLAVVRGLGDAGIRAEPRSCSKLEGAEAQVVTVLGDHTYGKPDVVLTLADDRRVRVSIKKPSTAGGQAHLQHLKRFAEVWALKYGALPEEVERWLEFFTGAPAGGELEAWSGVPLDVLTLVERRHRKLYPSTIEAHHPHLWAALLDWSRRSARQLADYCLFEGAAADMADRAEFIYVGSANRLLSRDEVLDAVVGVGVSPRKGGRTIDLPWGYLQTHDPRASGAPRHHPNQLQFHWGSAKLLTITGHGA